MCVGWLPTRTCLSCTVYTTALRRARVEEHRGHHLVKQRLGKTRTIVVVSSLAKMYAHSTTCSLAAKCWLELIAVFERTAQVEYKRACNIQYCIFEKPTMFLSTTTEALAHVAFRLKRAGSVARGRASDGTGDLRKNTRHAHTVAKLTN